jgi:hypothetical protein
VSKGTILDFAAIPVPAQGHFGQIVLMQEFAGTPFHAQISEPVTTHHRSQAWIVLGTCQNGFRLFSRGKDGTSFAIRQGIQGFGNAMFQSKLFKVVFNGIDSYGICRCHSCLLAFYGDVEKEERKENSGTRGKMKNLESYATCGWPWSTRGSKKIIWLSSSNSMEPTADGKTMKIHVTEK